MEKTLLDIVNSLKRYVNSVFYFFRSRDGFYSKIYDVENKYPEGERYFIFLFSFILFHTTSKSAWLSESKITNGFLSNFYDQALSNAQGNASFNYLFSRLLIFIIVAEALIFLLQREGDLKKYLSNLFYLSASWFMILICTILLLITLYNPVIAYFEFSEEVVENIEVIPVITLFVTFIYLYFRSFRAFSDGSIAGKFANDQTYKGFLVALLAPALCLGVSKDIVNDNKKDKVYFITDAQEERLTIHATVLGNDSVRLSTAFIFENNQHSNYVFNPANPPFITDWRIKNGEDDDGDDIIDVSKSDTIHWNLPTGQLVSLTEKTAEMIQLKSIVSFTTYRNLVFLQDSTVNKMITIEINPINMRPSVISKSKFLIVEE